MESKRFKIFRETLYDKLDKITLVCQWQMKDRWLVEEYMLTYEIDNNVRRKNFIVNHYTNDKQDNGFDIYWEDTNMDMDKIIDNIKI